MEKLDSRKVSPPSPRAPPQKEAAGGATWPVPNGNWAVWGGASRASLPEVGAVASPMSLLLPRGSNYNDSQRELLKGSKPKAWLKIWLDSHVKLSLGSIK
jgi:hypothetical protein